MGLSHARQWTQWTRGHSAHMGTPGMQSMRTETGRNAHSLPLHHVFSTSPAPGSTSSLRSSRVWGVSSASHFKVLLISSAGMTTVLLLLIFYNVFSKLRKEMKNTLHSKGFFQVEECISFHCFDGTTWWSSNTSCPSILVPSVSHHNSFLFSSFRKFLFFLFSSFCFISFHFFSFPFYIFGSLQLDLFK